MVNRYAHLAPEHLKVHAERLHIKLVDAFPVTRVGKLDKAALRKAIAEKVAAEKDR